jgi:dTDP-4-dehydrorhamnose 3,5-epimerase
MKFQATQLNGSYLIKRENYKDNRGFFDRIFCQTKLKNILKTKKIRQINRTLTKKEGTVRGLHFQYPPHAEAKIVSCLRGKVWDVAIDIRKGSPTFLKYHSVILSEENSESFFIPEGFAHGFQTLTNDCEMLYFHTADYNLESEGTINALDNRIKIKWPKIITDRSERDNNHPMLKENFLGIEV